MVRELFGDVRAIVTYREMTIDSLLVALCLLAWRAPRLGNRALRQIERWGSTIAVRKGVVTVSVVALAIGLRMTVLWLNPVPVPTVHDEFSYLLAADTFVHGRLTNPPHPMGVFFETFHVNMLPTYMSKYPPAQGAFLALGQRLGHAWIGVLLSVAAFGAAGLWMLQGWFPARWALLGGVLLLLRLGVFNYWVNSYWGGAVAAAGGAFALGALPRIIRNHRTRDSLILALGVSVLVNSRPLEGLVLTLAVLAVLFGWAFSKRSPAWRLILPRVVLPFGGAITLRHFHGLLQLARHGQHSLASLRGERAHLYQHTTFFWEKPRAPLQYSNPQFETFYNRWMTEWWLKGSVNSLGTAVSHIFRAVRKVIYFFVWPELSIPLLILPCSLFARRCRVLMFLMGAFVIGTLLNRWAAAHYFAPFTLVLFGMVVEGIRRLRVWDYQGRRVGIAISRVIVLLAIVGSPLHPYPYWLNLSRTAVALLSPIDRRVRQWQQPPDGGITREEIERRLDNIPGENLVIVRYGADHDVHNEWVYNRADIDHAKVVWAREIPGMDIQPLLDYFRGRRVWLLEPDADQPQLRPYP